MIGSLDAKIPDGPIEGKWEQHQFDVKLVNPANKRRYEIIVVGSGLAGASAAASLGELGYHVDAVHVPRLAATRATASPRRAASTRRRTTRTTATASSASSTTR